MIIFFYKNDARKLRQIITGLLKSWAATEIMRINYLQSYTLKEAKIEKTQEKGVIIKYQAENKGKIEMLLKKSGIEKYEVIR